MASIAEADEMKRALRKIARNINTDLLSTLMGYMSISVELCNKFKTPELFLVDQLFNNDLQPWIIAGWLKTLGHTELAMDFETFAKKYNFPQDIISKGPEIATMQLLKYLKSELTQEELYGMRSSKSETFEDIFRYFVDSLTPSLTELKIKLQDEYREDLAYKVITDYSPIISTMEPAQFKRTLTMCLDTLDVDIFSLLSALREALSKEFSYFQTLSIETKQFSYITDFIQLTFTAEVDTRTLPLTEGSDAELLTLMENANKREKKETRYIDAHSEIYSIVNQEKLISLIGHPGTGKTFYCNKLINEFTNSVNNAFRLVLLLSCRNRQWYTIEEKYLKNPHQTQEMLHDLLLVAVPTFHNSEDLVAVILKTEGRGLLLVIDSFDEFYSYDLLDSTLLYKIIKRQVLTKATILITSRPGAWNKLLSDYKDHFQFQHSWQLIGFSPEQRDQYILHMLSPVKAELCHSFLVNKPELSLLSLVPVNISLITGLVDSTDLLKHINTLTDAYTSLVLFTLNKELNRISPHSVSISTLQSMPADMRTVFNKLTELCYNGLIARKITFSPEEFAHIETSNNKYVKGLGLLQIIRVITAHFSVEEYLSCPHLTLQEFLSAWHLAQKSPRVIKSIVQQTFSDGTWPAMKVCFRFLCGILTQGHNTIINIITDNLLRTSAPLLDCKYAIFNLNDYAKIHYNNTATYLSALPYVLETNQPSIIASYYKLLCPANSTIPHFYLRDNITPVDTYFLTQYFSLLPPNSAISVLSIDITLLNSIQLDMLASFINITCIDTLLVTFSSTTDTSLNKHAKKQYIEDFKYEIQQLHVSICLDSYMLTPLDELNRIITYDISSYNNIAELQYILSQLKHHIAVSNSATQTDNIPELQYILSPLKLPITISNSDTQTDNIHIQKLFSFIRNIANASCLHTPKHIYYQFNSVSFMDDEIMNTLIDTISSNATYVSLAECYFSPQFITTLVTSLSKLEYLYIDDINLRNLRSQLKDLTINAISFQKLIGLYLHNVTLLHFYMVYDSTLYEYLQLQSTLQELHLYNTNIQHLYNTTDSTLDTLHAIQHLTSLHYLHIEPKLIQDNDSESVYLTILHNNRHKLSYVSFRAHKYITERYIDIMSILSQCPNLQYIDLYNCYLTPLHMPALATTINQLPALLYINMRSNRYITDEAIITLTDTLATHNTVIWIDLSNCRLSSAPVIISLINKFPCLQKIELDYNKFNDTSKEELKMFTKQRKINLSV